MKKRSRASARVPAISILVDEPRWREDISVRRLIRHAVRLALASPPHPTLSPLGGEGGQGKRGARHVLPGAGEGERRSVTILLTDDKRLRALNARFRGKDKPTNVLSFPAADDAAHLGDIALAYGVVKREAREQTKSFAAHAAHLAVHGTLHLRGFNHEKTRQARVMEALETAILARLGIADPYATRPYTKAGKAA